MRPLRHRVVRISRGFTLVELLAAMAVLAVLVLMLARMFSESQRAWTLGQRSAQGNMAGRAVMDFMARDLGTAVISTNFTMAHYQDWEIGDFTYDPVNDDPRGDRLYFLNLSDNVTSGDRSLQEVVYYITNMVDTTGAAIPFKYKLMRAFTKNSNQASYKTRDWCVAGAAGNDFNIGGNYKSDIVAENVWSFDIWYYSTGSYVAGFSGPGAEPYAEGGQGGLKRISPHNPAAYYTGDTGPPVFLDILLEMLDEDDAERVATIATPNTAAAQKEASDYARQRARRYFARVYFRNTLGYLND
ncbi:MAG: prepilin-type N-terminal cleavage/methylation domain-containing protein [Verrucomicrobia bacterium]|nr:prepilin-type N-terminal cleavage/methylation domain-containing protein [Verrucomicrobiota bacterium]